MKKGKELPPASTAGELYLQAILDEIVALRQDLAGSREEVSLDPSVMRVKEPNVNPQPNRKNKKNRGNRSVTVTP